MSFRMIVEDVFAIRNRGTVATGRIESGVLRVGDTVRINDGPEVRVDAIERFRKSLQEATVGENVGVLLKGIEKDQLSRGDILSSVGEASTAESATFIL